MRLCTLRSAGRRWTIWIWGIVALGTVVLGTVALGTVAKALAPTPLGSMRMPAVSVAFEDLAEASGLQFRYFNGMSGELYLPEIMGGGAALFDCDGDGDLDVFFVQGRMLGPGKTPTDALFPVADPSALRDRLFRNDTTAVPPDAVPEVRFADITSESGILGDDYGMGVLAADLDGDGKSDLYVANLGRNRLWRNLGNCRFEDATDASHTGDESWSIAATAFDYDRDGLLDLYVVNYLDFRFYRHRRCASEVAKDDYCGPHTYPGQADRLYRNTGNGKFVDVTESAGVLAPDSRGMGAVAADFNGDGLIDLYVANDQMTNHLWLNQGDGTFVDGALLAGVGLNGSGRAEASMGVVATDFDADGHEDLFVANLTGESNTLYMNLGGGIFDDASIQSGLAVPSLPYTGFGAVALDLDSDGCLDLAVVNGAIKTIEALSRQGEVYPLHQMNQLFRCVTNADGSAHFSDISALGGPAFQLSEVSRGLAVGDVDNDGRPDLLVVNSEGPSRLLLNRSPERRWLGIVLEGVDSPTDGLGSRVAVLSAEGKPVQWRRAHTDGSYASSSDPRLLFGLGGSSRAGESGEAVPVRVHWTSGRIEDFAVRTGRYETLVEGRGASP